MGHDGWPGTARWVRACVTAETIGMTAAATAAVLAQGLDTSQPFDSARWWGLAVVVAGGLVEGIALGILQARALRRMLGADCARRWALGTALFAGLGWAAASAPAALSSDDSASTPPLPLVLLGAVGLGLVMGTALGSVQALVLRGRVAHPWRWVAVSALGWTPAMAVIFAGATAPSISWPAGAVIATGAVTGAAAGAVLGLVTGPLLPTLSARPGTVRPGRHTDGQWSSDGGSPGADHAGPDAVPHRTVRPSGWRGGPVRR